MFSVEYVAQLVSKLSNTLLTSDAAIALTAAVDTVAAEILELVGYRTQNRKSNLISSRDVMLAISGDKELVFSFPGSFRDAGAPPVKSQLDSPDIATSSFSQFGPIFKTALRDTPFCSSLIDPRDGLHYIYDPEDDSCVHSPELDSASAHCVQQRMEMAFRSLSEEHQKLARLEMQTDFLDPDLDLNRHAKNIIRLQNTGGLCINPIAFRQIVLSIAKKNQSCARFSEEAFGYLHTSAEHYLYSILCKANAQSADLGRVVLVLTDRDIMSAKASYQRFQQTQQSLRPVYL